MNQLSIFIGGAKCIFDVYELNKASSTFIKKDSIDLMAEAERSGIQDFKPDEFDPISELKFHNDS